jgi:hypothetical protein
MDYLLFQEQLWNRISSSVLKVKIRIADHMSVYPDPSDLLLVTIPARTALECIVDIWALEYSLPGTRTRHQTFTQRERMARLVQTHRREGHWKVVEELLQQPQGLCYYETVLLRHFSPEDIFGNLVPALKKRLSSMRPQSKRSLELRRQRRMVKRPIRRRGYPDHGSLRPHSYLGPEYYARPALPPEPEVTFRAPRPFQWIPQKKVIPQTIESPITLPNENRVTISVRVHPNE